MNLIHRVGVIISIPLWLAAPMGLADDTVLTPAPVTNGTAASISVPDFVLPRGAVGMEVGISSRDGITYSAPDVLVTRNGISRQLTREIRLANGTLVRPDGMVITGRGAGVMIRPEQVLTFGGIFEDAPIVGAVIDDSEETVALVRRAGASQARPASGAARMGIGTK